jgi:hypothetical protein
VPFLKQSSGDKKARESIKNTTINHQNGGGGHVWLLEKAPMF